MTGFVLIPKDVATDIRVLLASIGQPDYLPVKDTPERRANAERLYRELLTARSAAKLEAAERERDLAIRNASDGWLYHCPDTGTEWSEQHPVESGEVPDAEDVRAATATAFLNELIPAWEELAKVKLLGKTDGARIAKLEAALTKALAVIDDYLDYRHDGDPWSEDARLMGEMRINDYGRDGSLTAAKALLSGELA